MVNTGSNTLSYDTCLIDNSGAFNAGGVGHIVGATTTLTLLDSKTLNSYSTTSDGGIFNILSSTKSTIKLYSRSLPTDTPPLKYTEHEQHSAYVNGGGYVINSATIDMTITAMTKTLNSFAEKGAFLYTGPLVTSITLYVENALF